MAKRKTSGGGGISPRPSADVMKLARKAGFKRKAPKKPLASASLATLQSWVGRWNQWVKDAQAKATEAKRKESEVVKRNQIRQRIAGI